MSRRTAQVLASAVFVAALLAGPAKADVAQQMTAELQAAGLPSASVTVATPSPATPQDVAAFQAGTDENAASLSNDNLISPDPSAPLPLAKVRYGAATATRYPDFLSPPGGTWWASVEDTQEPLWQLQIMSALKHALASGASLSGVSIDPSFPNRENPGTPVAWVTPPDPQDLPPVTLSPTLPTATAEQDIRNGLPTWAGSADVQVRDWVANERRVTVSLNMPWPQVVVSDIDGLVSYLLDHQLALNQEGAGIGSVVVSVKDPTTGLPVLTYAGDATWGQNFSWMAPALAAYQGKPSSAVTIPSVEDVNEAVAGAQEPPEPPPLP